MKKIIITVSGLILLGLLIFVIWASTPLGPQPEAFDTMPSDESVLVQSSGGLIFSPVNKNPSTGVILYPGGRVDYRSYAPLARAIAEQGYVVIIPRIVLNLAVFSVDAADKYISNFPQIDHWIIGGHSLGGAMAASYTYQNPEIIDGLILVSAYSTEASDLSEADIPVISISGSQDGLSTPEKVKSYSNLLPPDANFVFIEGGNHAQMGNYGSQPGDGIASISQRDQQEIVVENIIQFLQSIQ